MNSTSGTDPVPRPTGGHPDSVESVLIKVLGALEVVVDGDRIGVGGPQQRLVLATLLSRTDSAVSTESLIDALWPDDDPPDRARKTVQVYVANLRKELGGPDAPIESAPGGYVFRSAEVNVDAVDFEQAVAATGPAGDLGARETVERLSAALGLWNGTPYADLDDAPALTAEIARLSELRLVALERRVEASLTLGHHREVLSALETLTTDHPYRERFTALHMLALYRSGRQAEALRAYQRTRRILGEELGIGPSPEVQALEQAILDQDPSLDLAASPADEPRADAGSIRGYELREQLGEANDTTLWRAYQPATAREVTLRMFGPELANQPTFVKRFETETQRVAQLEHPHLVSIYDFWRDPDGAYIVMPLLRGGTLGDSLGRGPWKLSAALRMLDQVGAGLATLHRHGLHHGALEAASVFLDADSNAYLADAGVTDRTDSGSDAAQADVAALATLLARTIAPDQLSAELDAVLAGGGEHGRVEDLLRAVRQVTGSDAVGVASDLDANRPAATNPYKGLRAFQETDAGDFFGREILVDRLIETVIEQPLTAVVGSSGSGKSSVVKAGLVPAMKGGALGGDWVVAEMFPGTFPFEELEAALLRVAVDRPDNLMAELTADDRGMLRVIKRVLPDDGTGLLLVIDQFEELFSLTPDDDTRRLFLDSLVTLGSDARSRVRTVVTLRADFFDRPLDHPDFGDLIRRGLVTVSMPDQDSLALMVSQPARQAGFDLEPGLVSEVVRDVMEQPGGLPLMQYALTELAERSDGRTLTTEGYRESGGVIGALAQRAEETFQGLQPSTRDVAERIFLRLVTVDDQAEDTRRRIRRTELDALGLDRGAVETVLQAFGSFRLLSFDHDPTTRGPTVEVAHEALIREWPRLRSWVDEQRESLLLERRLREAVAEWNGSARDSGYLLRGGRLAQFESWAAAEPGRTTEDERSLIADSRAAADAEHEAERRQIRRLRRLVVGVGVALVLALIAGALAFREQGRAEDAAEAAELATLISRSAALAGEDPDVSLLLALEAYRRSPGVDSEAAVLDAVSRSARVAAFPALGDPADDCFIPMTSADGLHETAIIDGALLRRDLTTGEIVDHGPAPTDCGRWIGDANLGRVIVESTPPVRHWVGSFGGSLEPVDFGPDSSLASDVFRPNHRIAFLLDRDPFLPPALTLRDDQTGEQIGPVIAPPGFAVPVSGASTTDGSLFALAFFTERDPGGEDGWTLLIDGESGEEILVHRSDWPAELLRIDEQNNHLVAWMLDGTIRTIDIETGAEVPELRIGSTTTSRPVELGIRADGVVIAVSESQIELLDRETGPIQNPIATQNVRRATVRADGAINLRAPDESIEVIDPESNALIATSWTVDPTAHPAYKDGWAAAMETPPVGSPSAEVAVTVDLTTGERTEHKLITADGDRFPVLKLYPEPDGALAFSERNVMIRWRGDQEVDRLELGGWHVVRTQFGELIGVITERDDGVWVADLVTTDGEPRSLFRVDARGATELHPSRDGGLHIAFEDGTVRTHDSTGELIGVIDTGVERIGFMAVDPVTGRVALVSAGHDAVLVDPATEAIERVPDVGRISTLGFGRNGEILVLTMLDGRVRLWDVEAGRFAGQAWSGTGQANTGSPSWYDDANDTMWVASSGRYLGIPLNPERWVERACEIVRRELTLEEWETLVPGDAQQRPACP